MGRYVEVNRILLFYREMYELSEPIFGRFMRRNGLGTIVNEEDFKNFKKKVS